MKKKIVIRFLRKIHLLCKCNRLKKVMLFCELKKKVSDKGTYLQHDAEKGHNCLQQIGTLLRFKIKLSTKPLGICYLFLHNFRAFYDFQICKFIQHNIFNAMKIKCSYEYFLHMGDFFFQTQIHARVTLGSQNQSHNLRH